MRRKLKLPVAFFFVVTLSLFLNGCGGGGASGGPATVDISSGTWFGDHTENGIDKVEFSFIATQRGDSITGDIAWNGLNPAIYATYTGTISGLNITLSWTQAGTTITLSGSVSADGTTMSGMWSSSNGTSGTWQATKLDIIAN